MPELVALLESVGRSLASFALRMNLWLLLVFLAVALADRILASRVSAASRILLYGVLLIRLLIPLDWALPLDASRTVATPVARWVEPALSRAQAVSFPRSATTAASRPRSPTTPSRSNARDRRWPQLRSPGASLRARP